MDSLRRWVGVGRGKPGLKENDHTGEFLICVELSEIRSRGYRIDSQAERGTVLLHMISRGCLPLGCSERCFAIFMAALGLLMA